MCGIAGFTHCRAKPDAARIREATLSLTHRGPDQQGTFETDTISLGAVRLRIIDLEGGDQPLHSYDGATTVVFNGEIYNNTELREELRSLGHDFRSRCDTETVLHAFLQWDTDCFARLRGMFALAIWNEPERRLVLARDRMGIKPLYLARRGADLYFGSELKAVFACQEIERRLNPEALHYFTSLNYVPGPLTMIDGIEKLPPGHWLEWRDSRERMAAYWRLRFEPDPRQTLDGAAEELDALLRASTREHLASDVPLGVWASGGLDSSTVLHYASEASSARLNTFSITFRGREFDEGGYARHVANYYGAEHHELDLNPRLDLTGAIEEIAYYSDEPGADAGALPVWFLSRMSRERVTVALSGEGADELFGGYQTYRADNYHRRLTKVPAAARRLALALASQLPVSDAKIGFDYKVRRMLSGSFLPPEDAHLYWNGAFSESEKKRLHVSNGFRPASSLCDALPGDARACGYLNRFLWLDQTFYLPDDILYKCDRMSMAHSLEVRPPFLDHRIVEFAARLPQRLKIRGSELKAVLRHLMRDKLPRQVLARKKEGFDIPAHDWLRGPLRALLLDTLNRRSVEDSGLFHWDEVQALIRKHLERRVNLGFQLWGLLTLFLWMKRWDVQTARIPEGNRALLGLSAATH